jgi:hypothetical protein
MSLEFTSHLQVDKQIVPLLSKSTYNRSFAYAVRELVSNAYDADALTVHISISEDYSRIDIEDDGNGMTKEEFDHYCTIAGQKHENKISRRYKRKRIGQFGIGFLSVFPFCESLKVTTTVENSSNILTANIPTIEFFNSNLEDEVSNIPIPGSILVDEKIKLKHFTKISLIKPSFLVKQYFAVPETNERKTIKKWNPIERFKWELQEDLPIPFKANSVFKNYLKYDEPIGLDVLLNNEKLYRNEFGKYLLAQGTETIRDIEYKYIITTNYSSIDPVEARGIKLRVNNVGIGGRTDFELKRSRGFSRLHWISGEVILSENIKQYLNIGRESFITNPDIEEFYLKISSKLRDIHQSIEDVDLAEKSLIDLSNSTGKDIQLKPREVVLSDNIAKLTSRGFKVVKSSNKGNGNPSIRIDKQSKTVFINDTGSLSEDFISICDQTFKVKYSTWNYLNSKNPSCRFIGNDEIEINQSYPLFKSKQYGSLLKRIHILILMSSKDNVTAKNMLEFIMKNFLNEFENYQP